MKILAIPLLLVMARNSSAYPEKDSQESIASYTSAKPHHVSKAFLVKTLTDAELVEADSSGYRNNGENKLILLLRLPIDDPSEGQIVSEDYDANKPKSHQDKQRGESNTNLSSENLEGSTEPTYEPDLSLTVSTSYRTQDSARSRSENHQKERNFPVRHQEQGSYKSQPQDSSTSSNFAGYQQSSDHNSPNMQKGSGDKNIVTPPDGFKISFKHQESYRKTSHQPEDPKRISSNLKARSFPGNHQSFGNSNAAPQSENKIHSTQRESIRRPSVFSYMSFDENPAHDKINTEQRNADESSTNSRLYNEDSTYTTTGASLYFYNTSPKPEYYESYTSASNRDQTRPEYDPEEKTRPSTHENKNLSERENSDFRGQVDFESNLRIKDTKKLSFDYSRDSHNEKSNQEHDANHKTNGDAVVEEKSIPVLLIAFPKGDVEEISKDLKSLSEEEDRYIPPEGFSQRDPTSDLYDTSHNDRANERNNSNDKGSDDLKTLPKFEVTNREHFEGFTPSVKPPVRYTLNPPKKDQGSSASGFEIDTTLYPKREPTSKSQLQKHNHPEMEDASSRDVIGRAFRTRESQSHSERSSSSQPQQSEDTKNPETFSTKDDEEYESKAKDEARKLLLLLFNQSKRNGQREQGGLNNAAESVLYSQIVDIGAN